MATGTKASAVYLLRLIGEHVVTAGTAPALFGAKWETRFEALEAERLAAWRHGKFILTRAGRLALETNR